MTDFEVPEPILNSPYEEPARALVHPRGRAAAMRARAPSGRCTSTAPRPPSRGTERRRAAAVSRSIRRLRAGAGEPHSRAPCRPGAMQDYPGRHPHHPRTAQLLAARRPRAAAVLRPARGRRDHHLPEGGPARTSCQGIDIPLRRAERGQQSRRATRRSAATPARWPRARARPPSWACWPPGAS